MENNNEKKPTLNDIRHWFVGFWLKAIMVLNALMVIFVSTFALNDGADFSLIVLVSIFQCLLFILGAFMLLYRSRSGFMIVLMAPIIGTIANLFVNNPNIEDWIAPFISTIILYIVLQIKKNGVSYWKLLK